MQQTFRAVFNRPLRRFIDFKRAQSTKPHVSAKKPEHTPVLLQESIDALFIEEGQLYVDMTFGAGGHTRAMLERGARVVAIDRDPSVVNFANALTDEFGKGRFTFAVAKFTDIRDVLMSRNIRLGSVAGLLIDCGCSSMQMDQARGFSISVDAPLDMRMNPLEKDAPPAAALVNVLDAECLAKIFKAYGGEKNAVKIAHAIVNYRYEMKRIRTTKQLAEIVETAFSEGHLRTDSLGRPTSLATKIFMALRIFVNDELNELNNAIILANQILRPGARASVISFHSLEDRIVKRHFLGIDMNEPVSNTISQKYKNSTAWDLDNKIFLKWNAVEPKLILPRLDEIESNPRSRSAKLRVAEKIDS